MKKYPAPTYFLAKRSERDKDSLHRKRCPLHLNTIQNATKPFGRPFSASIDKEAKHLCASTGRKADVELLIHSDWLCPCILTHDTEKNKASGLHTGSNKTLTGTPLQGAERVFQDHGTLTNGLRCHSEVGGV